MPTLQVDQALADQMVDQAIQMCADLKFRGDLKPTLQALHLGRCDICSTVSECLVHHVGEYLGRIDRTVKAVYQYEPEFTSLKPREVELPVDSRPAGINLVAWVERKSAALTALAATLENVLSESRKRIPCKNACPACYILDIQMIEDQDVQDGRGYGMVVNSMFVRSLRVWRRRESFSKPVSTGSIEYLRDLQIQAGFFDPELSPESTLFEQAETIENLPVEERHLFEHRLREIKVVLIRRLISDQLAYVNIAKEWFSFADLAEIYRRRIGLGRIGGKAAGMALAARILNEAAEEPLRSCIRVPESFYLGSDLIYLFMAMNGLMHWNSQKYKREDQIRSEYPQLYEDFLAGDFPPEILPELSAVLEKIGPKPVIVRSSSLLEDNFGTSFAGKYESIFLPNQGTPGKNLEALTRAIARIYASTLKPDALLYRRSKGLQDFDERMAVLIQAVEGEQYGRYYFPFGAGVAFSRNMVRWSPQIRKEDGIIRLVFGLGTRAVERVGNDYPRLVALSHPTLYPDDSTESIRNYSQHNMDLIDLEDKELKTLPVHEVIRPDYPYMRYLVQIEEDGYFSSPRGRVMAGDIPHLAVTYDELLRRTPFASMMTRMLHILQEEYHVPIDLEFTARLTTSDPLRAQLQITLLQCRPQSVLRDTQAASIPVNFSAEQVIFQTSFMVPQGCIDNISKVIFISPEGYFQLQTQAARNAIRRTIAKLNAILQEKSFICVGPGRWGTVNPDLGVFVSYSDINFAAALVELSGGFEIASDPSLGTHFFQDLMEANIYPLAVRLEDKNASLNQKFFYETPNRLSQYVELEAGITDCVRLIDVADYAPGCDIRIVMDDEKNQAAAFCVPSPGF